MAKHGSKRQRKKAKAIECWAPIVRETGRFCLNMGLEGPEKPKDHKSLFSREDLTYIRVRITPIRTKKRGRHE